MLTRTAAWIERHLVLFYILGFAVTLVLAALISVTARGGEFVGPPRPTPHPTPSLPDPWVRRFHQADCRGCDRLLPGTWRVHSGDRIHLFEAVGPHSSGDVYLAPTGGQFAAPIEELHTVGRARAATARLEALLADAPAVWIEPTGMIRAGRPLVRLYRQIEVAVPTAGGRVRHEMRVENVVDRMIGEGFVVRTPQARSPWTRLTMEDLL